MLETLFLFLAIALLWWLPGWLTLRVMLGRSLTLLEETVFSFGIGLTLINVLMLILDRLGLPLSFTVLTLTFAVVNVVLGTIFWYQRKKLLTPHSSLPTPELSSKVWAILLLMFVLTIGIKAYYLVPAGLPTATDMGHHMYWSHFMVEKEFIPPYEKIELVVDPATGTTTVAPPKPIADFIIGEHLPFTLLAKLTGLSFMSSFPVLVLLLINLFSLLTLLALVIRVSTQLFDDAKTSHWFIVGSFLFVGPLFALASPQAKFVSGGVVGNLFGNFFIPLILLALYFGLREGLPRLVALALILMATLAYTHHLSTLILGFVLIGIVLVSLLSISGSSFVDRFKAWWRIFWKPSILLSLLGIGLFALIVTLPTYLEPRAIDSALGSPVKTTRTGLSWTQVSQSVGIVKMALALSGLALLIAGFRRFSRDPLGLGLLIGWGVMLGIMSLRPHWVFLDIPSNRVGSYLVYPASLLAGLTIAILMQKLTEAKQHFFAPLLATLLLAIIIGNGVFENGSILLDKSKADEAQEVFAVSQYLSERVNEKDMILKDHNYLVADSWMKLFFLRDYGYPLSRGLFSRYSETGNRKENCTMLMIASPNSAEGKQCFDSTGTNYIVVNPTYDAVQFEKSPDFAKVYMSEHVAVFKRLVSRPILTKQTDPSQKSTNSPGVCGNNECLTIVSPEEIYGDATLTGYYSKITRRAWGEKKICDGFTITGGSPTLKDYFAHLVKIGNTVNSVDSSGKPVINVNLDKLPDEEKLKLTQSTAKNQVDLLISIPQTRGTGAPVCYSFVNINTVK